MKLVVANREQKRVRDAVTHPAWGTGLTVEQYLERECQLRDHPWARSAMTSWLLCDDAVNVLSSCETFRMPSGQGGKTGCTYGVASVYTEPALRGKGYASQMMNLLARRLVEEDAAAQAVILFSDVGAPLYARAGFVARPAYDWTFSAAPGDPATAVDGLVSEDQVSEVMALLARSAEPFVVLPVASQVDWHLERERIYAGVLERQRPPACGARVGSSFVLWATNFIKDELALLVLQATRSDEQMALLTAARRMAFQASLPTVRAWEAAPLWEHFQGGTRSPRQGGLPMLKSLCPGLSPEDWHWIPRALWI